MEREHFRDRPESVQYHDSLFINALAFICTKEMQPKAKELKDLTLVRMTKSLTSVWKHPRGQKIRGSIWVTDKYGNPKDEIGEEVVGRCTYIVESDEFSVETKQGFKCILYNKNTNKIELVPIDEIKGKCKLAMCFSIGEFKFFFDICPYLFFNTQEEAILFAENLEIENIIYQSGKIMYQLFGENVCQKKYKIYLKDEKLGELDAFQYICKMYPSLNNASYEMNKTFAMEVENIEIKIIE